MVKAGLPKAGEKNFEFLGGHFSKGLRKIVSPAYCGPGPPQGFHFKPIEFRSGQAIEKEVSIETAKAGPKFPRRKGKDRKDWKKFKKKKSALHGKGSSGNSRRGK